MYITNLTRNDIIMCQQAAQLLVEGFKENWPNAWSTFEDAFQDLQELFDKEGYIGRIAIEGELVLGWIGAIPMYECLGTSSFSRSFRLSRKRNWTSFSPRFRKRSLSKRGVDSLVGY